MPRGNPSPKLAITVDPDVHQNILAAAERDGVSISAWMTTAAREALQRRAGLAAIAEWEREHGRFNRSRDGGGPSDSKGATPKASKSGPAVRMSAVVYDSAVLVAADRNERRTWMQHRARLEFGIVPFVPAPVVAQVSRSPQQAQLRRFLAGCNVVPLGEIEAQEAGRLLGATRTVDVVDARRGDRRSDKGNDSHRRFPRH